MTQWPILVGMAGDAGWRGCGADGVDDSRCRDGVIIDTVGTIVVMADNTNIQAVLGIHIMQKNDTVPGADVISIMAGITASSSQGLVDASIIADIMAMTMIVKINTVAVSTLTARS